MCKNSNVLFVGQIVSQASWTWCFQTNQIDIQETFLCRI